MGKVALQWLKLRVLEKEKTEAEPRSQLINPYLYWIDN